MTRQQRKAQIIDVANTSGLEVVETGSWFVQVRTDDDNKLRALWKYADVNDLSFVAISKYRKTGKQSSVAVGAPVAYQVEF